MATKTREETEALKENWRRDPCWDIEDTEGYEEHNEELLAYRKQVEAEWEQKKRERTERRAGKMKEETGITDPVAAQCLFTFAEIETQINNAGDGDATKAEITISELGQAQARATLLLAAQVKRLADMYGRYLDNLDADAEREEIRNLYRR